MNLQKTKAFTLVELIVVITILAILGTIAFISLQGYSATSRDSVRISDMSSIKSSLELFNIDAGKYPNTSSGVSVTFSGGILRTQGTFGESTYKNVTKLDKIPKDPLTDIEYTYSVTNTAQEYEIAGIMESDNISMLNETYAAQKTAKAMVSGHYNGKIAKVFADGKTYVLAVPTIISGSGFTLEEIMANKSFVYNGYSNLPLNYNGSSYNTLGETNLNLVDSINYIVFSGSLSDLTNPKDATARIQMLENLQKAYTGSVIQDSAITEILAITDFSTTNPIAVNLAGTVVNNTLGASITTSSIDNTPEIVIDTTPPTDYIAYYPLTGTAEDKTGNYNGTENGGLTYISDANRGSVASFNNTSTNISLNYNIGTSTVSLSTWVKASTQAYNQRIFDSSSNNYSGFAQIVLDTSGKISVMQGNNSSIEENVAGTINIGDNNWHLVTAVINGNNVNIYIDGIFDISGTTNVLLSNDSSAYIGNTSNNSNGLIGNISNFKIFNRALSQQEITNIYNAEKDTSPVAVSDGLTAYYPLKNNSMDNWYNQYDGTASLVTYDGTSSNFMATDAKIAPPVTINSINSTISIWIKVDSTNTGLASMFGYISGQQQSFCRSDYAILNNGAWIFRLPTGEKLCTNTNERYHVVIVDNGSLIKVYTNNILRTNQLTYLTLNGFSMPTLGWHATGNAANLKGYLANFRVYNRALLDSEISEIYNTEKGDFGL